MKGIILGAGLGTRLYPGTIICNKHLEILYDKPVIYYSISVLMELNIKEIYVVCRNEDIDKYMTLLNDGKQWGITISYVLQDEAKGIVDGVKRCGKNVNGDACVVLLGDNFVFNEELPLIFSEKRKHKCGAIMTCIKRDYGHLISTIKFDEQGMVKDIVRVNAPRDEYISPGLFYYDKRLWEILLGLKDDAPWVEVNKAYLHEKELEVVVLSSDTIWHDVGVPDERLQAEEFIDKTLKKASKLIGCPEEMAYKNGWISATELDLLIGEMPKCQYKDYLMNLCNQKLEEKY